MNQKTSTISHDTTPSIASDRRLRRPRFSVLRALSFLALALVGLAGCDSSDNTSTVAVESPNALAFHESRVQVEEGARETLRPIDPSRLGRPTVSGARLSWTSSDQSVARVDGGVVRAVARGEARITARTGNGAEASVDVEVLRTPGSLSLGNQSDWTGQVGEVVDRPLEAQVLSAQGLPVDSVEVRFRIESGSGVVSPVVVRTNQEGIARSEWTLGGIAGRQSVRVEVLNSGIAAGLIEALAEPGPAFEVVVVPEEISLRPGSPFQFRADVVDAFGNSVGNLPVEWSTTDETVARAESDGWVTGLREGEASVEALPVEGNDEASARILSELAAAGFNQGRGNAHVLVQSADGESDATIAIMGGNNQEGPVGRLLPVELAIQVTDGAGQPIRQFDVSWSVSHGAATLGSETTRTNGQGSASNQLELGTTPGPVRVIADLGDLGQAEFNATAVPGDVSDVRVTPGSAALQIGGQLQLEAEVQDEYGNVIPDAPAPVWSSSAPTVASVGSDAWVEALDGGQTTIQASVEGVTGESVITVEEDDEDGSDGGDDTGGTDDGGGDDTSGGSDDGSDGSDDGSDDTNDGSDGTDGGSDGGDDGSDGSDGGSDDGDGTDDGSEVQDPAKVTDLEVTSTTSTTATVRFTQVDDGTGNPAEYNIRYHLHPIGWGWGDAKYPASGDCMDPVQGTTIGEPLVCTVEGLDPDTKYDFQLVSFRVEDGSRTFGPLSSVATGTTGADGGSNGGDDGGSDAVDVSLVEASHTSVAFEALEEEIVLEATALDATGTEVSGASFNWTSTEANVVSVSSAGQAIARGVGTALIVVSAACCDAATADTVSITVTQVVTAVDVSPGQLSLNVGESSQLGATALDANGYPVDDDGFSWESSNNSVVGVSESGAVSANGEGSATIHATYQNGSSGSVTVVVDDSSDSGDPTEPLVVGDFRDFTSVSDFLDSLPTARGWPIQEERMELVAEGHPGGSGRSVRFNFPDATSLGGSDREGRCGTTTIGFELSLEPLADIEERKEVWDEHWVKFSSNWTTRPPPEWNCTGNPDYKLLFGTVRNLDGGTSGSGRFNHSVGNNGTRWSLSVPDGHSVWGAQPNGSDALFDGQWYRIRHHMRVSSAPDTPDGRYLIWITDALGNEVLRVDSGPVVVNRRDVRGIAIGRNRNHHAGEEMSVSFGGFKIWTTDPGW